eukprot:7620840-Alexandrium_andersonii.AAC.1
MKPKRRSTARPHGKPVERRTSVKSVGWRSGRRPGTRSTRLSMKTRSARAGTASGMGRSCLLYTSPSPRD